MNRKEMPVSEHLSELRKRILVSLSAFIFASIISLPLVPMVLNKIRGDLLDIPLVVLAPQEALMVGLKLSLFIGFILSFPVLVYQLWSFIAPGLIEREKKVLLHILLPSTLLFLLGAGFAYYLLLPITLRFLIGVSYAVAYPLFSLSQTFSFVITLILLFGLIFQLPLVVAVLTRIGLVDHIFLKSKRRYVILSSFIAAAVITDPSVVTQILVSIPIILLYELSIWISRYLKK